MLQLTAPSYAAAQGKIHQLPSGSWGLCRVPSADRILAFSVCGDDQQVYSYRLSTFNKSWHPGMAAMLRNQAAKTPISKEVKRKALKQAYNNIDGSLDHPTDANAINAVPSAPTAPDDF